MGNDVIVVADRMSGVAALRPITCQARRWFEANVVAESWQRSGDTVAMDKRCASDVIDALIANGFKVSNTDVEV